MPNWKKVIVSGSDASLNSLAVTTNITAQSFTGSLQGTASFALTASYVPGSTTGVSYTLDQTSPSATWTVNHNLNNAFPVITVYDGNGFVLVPSSIQSTSINQTVITFSYPATGYATAVVEGITNTSSSYAQNATSASYAVTASYALNGGSGGSGLKTKAGSVINTSFGGTPLTSSITFSAAFPNTNYAIVVTGEDARSWIIQNKAAGSFIINSNSSVALTGSTYWIATAYGETT